MSESQPSEEHSLLPNEVRRKLNQIAVIHPTRSEWQSLERKPNAVNFFDITTQSDIENQIVESAQHPATLEISMHDDTEESSKKLHAVQSVVSREARREIEDGRNINWHDIALRLLDSAKGNEKESQLTAAVVCSLFAPDVEDRIDFMREVYKRDVQKDIADACENSPIMLLLEGPNAEYKDPDTAYAATKVQSIKSFDSAFKLETAAVMKYLHLVESSTVDDSLPSAKSVQKRIVEGGGVSEPDLAQKAADVSLNGGKVKGVLIDPTRLEKIAIQQTFIRDQMQEVIGPDIRSTPLKDKLVAARSEKDKTEIEMPQVAQEVKTPRMLAFELGENTEEAIEELSASVVEKFNVSEGEQQELTKKQEANLRFHDLINEVKGGAAIAHFLDINMYNKSLSREIVIAGIVNNEVPEVWTLSEGGAAAPRVAVDTITNVVQGALNNPNLGKVSEDELYAFCQKERRSLLAIATRNIKEFPNDDDVLMSRSILLERNEEDGQLVLRNKVPLVGKEKLDEYAALTLGCPALREIHEDRQTLEAEEKIIHGSSNYIDHILAVVINEAYERGIFDLSQYTVPAAA